MLGLLKIVCRYGSRKTGLSNSRFVDMTNCTLVLIELDWW
jgi:hypothetical protein